MNKIILLILIFGLTTFSAVQDAFGAITCRNNSTGARSCTNNLVCPTGWTKISSSCSTQTVGGSITYITHHGIAIKCTWQEFQGSWDAEPGSSTVPISVAHAVEGENNFATCSGWEADSVPTGIPNHGQAPYGMGQFLFSVRYQSAAFLSCEEDPNSGIGNNCTKTDAQNPKHGGSGSTTPGASRACKDASSGYTGPGTQLTYQFACADGVSVTGFLTLAPTVIEGGVPVPQPNPEGSDGSFTNCSAERIAAGACTMQLGGIPTTTVKVKGQNVTVVDSAACAAAFPAGAVPNAFSPTGQIQNLDVKEILFYQEVASEGICDPVSKLPTVPGLPAAAYGRYCQSDLGVFSDNTNSPTGGGIFLGDSSTLEGFDNQLRVCPAVDNVYHTAAQDVEQVALGAGVTMEFQPTLNLNCTTGGNTDSGGYTVKIPDQAPLLSIDIDTSPLSDAPKLEGISPASARIVVENGIRKLSLRYPTCNSVPGDPAGGLSGVVQTNNPGVQNQDNVTLHLSGQTNGAGPGSLGPIQFDGEFTIKVNGL